MKHTMYYMPSIPEMPKQLFAEIKSAVKTMALTHQIEAELADGRPIEAILASHLPSQDAEKNHADAELIEKGIYDVYGSLNDQKDEEWTAQQINMGMNGLQEADRIRYLKNIVALTCGSELDLETRCRIDAVDEYADEEERAFLVTTANDAIRHHADILCRSSVQTMNTALHRLGWETVRSLEDAGIEQAKAYAVACYLMNQCGEDPWCTGQKDIADQDPYHVGAIAAANIESSKLMVLRYRGKIALDTLRGKLQSLFTRVITFVSEHWAIAATIAVQGLIAFKLFDWSLDFMTLHWDVLGKLLFKLHMGPWEVIVGGAVLSLLVSTKVISVQDVTNVLNAVWNAVKNAWNWAREQLHQLVSENADQDEDDDEFVFDDEEENADLDVLW